MKGEEGRARRGWGRGREGSASRGEALPRRKLNAEAGIDSSVAHRRKLTVKGFTDSARVLQDEPRRCTMSGFFVRRGSVNGFLHEGDRGFHRDLGRGDVQTGNIDVGRLVGFGVSRLSDAPGETPHDSRCDGGGWNGVHNAIHGS